MEEPSEFGHIGLRDGELLMFDEDFQDYPVTEVPELHIEDSTDYGFDDWESESIRDYLGKSSESSSRASVDSNSAGGCDRNTGSSNYPQGTNSKESDLAHRKGRRTKEETLVLSRFSNVRYPYSKPKKEYVRVKLIRGFKRAVRQVADKILPRKKVHGFEKRDKNGLAKWAHFCLFVNANPALKDISPTSISPGGRNQGKESNFNDRFCREFFGNELVRAAFGLYLDLIFMNEDDKKLSKKFEFCATAEEKWERNEAWEKLRQYLYEGMFKNLDMLEEAESIEEDLRHIKLEDEHSRTRLISAG